MFQAALRYGARVGRLVEADRVRGEPHRGQPGRAEERLRAERPAEEEVVVEVDEVLGKVGRPVQRRLDRVRVERRQRVGRQDRAVVDHRDLRVATVQPLRHLAGGDEVDPAHPRREEVDAPERVAQLVARDEPRLAARLAGRGGAGQPGQPVEPGLVPRRVAAVDPGVRRRRPGTCTRARSARPSAAASGRRRPSTAVVTVAEPSGEPLGVAVARSARPAARRRPPPRTPPRRCSPGRAPTVAGLGAGRRRPRLERDHRGPPAEQVGGQLGDGRRGARASRWRPGRAARGTTAPRAAASSWRNRCRAAIGSTTTGVRVSCGGTTSHSSVAARARPRRPARAPRAGPRRA